MSDFLLDEQGVPTTPGAGSSILFPHNYATKKSWAIRNSDGMVCMVPGLINQSVADQATAAGVDTYVTGANILVPAQGLQVGTIFRWRIGLTKSAAGTAAPAWIVRVGTAGAIGDTARITFTQVAAQTAAADAAVVDIQAIVRTIGAAGVMHGVLMMGHVLAATGFSTLNHNVQQVASAGFDMTVANLFVGLSMAPGASGVWTAQNVVVEALNL